MLNLYNITNKFEYRHGDIFEQKDLDYIAHQCNCFHCMGGGIAYQVAKRFPNVRQADIDLTLYANKLKIGTNLVVGVTPLRGIYHNGIVWRSLLLEYPIKLLPFAALLMFKELVKCRRYTIAELMYLLGNGAWSKVVRLNSFPIDNQIFRFKVWPPFELYTIKLDKVRYLSFAKFEQLFDLC